MSKVIIKAKKSGGLSSEFQNCNDSREVKLEIAPLDIISKQAIGKKEQILLIFKKIVKLNFKNQFHENKNAFKSFLYQPDKAQAQEAVPIIYSKIIFQPIIKATNSPTVT